MSFRKTGKFITNQVEVKEEYCDQCLETIPPNTYPQYELHIENGEYESTSIVTLCSSRCLSNYGRGLR